MKLLLVNIFTFHRSLRKPSKKNPTSKITFLTIKQITGEGEDSIAHRYAHLLIMEMTSRVGRATPHGNPHPESPHLTHLSVFLDWAIHLHELLHPLVQEVETLYLYLLIIYYFYYYLLLSIF